MNITINGERLSDHEPAGPEIYTINIIKSLSKIDQVNKYVIALKSPTDLFSNLPVNFKTIVIHKFMSWTQLSLASYLFKNPPDIFFTAVHTYPILKPNKTKIISMIHGLEFKKNNIGNGLPEMLTCMFSDQIIVPSETTKSAIYSKKWSFKNKCIMVVPEGVSDDFKMQDDISIFEARKRFNLENINYAIFISTIQPRKNLPKLIEAFFILNTKYNVNLHLVVIGKKGWDYEESLYAPEKFNIKDKIQFLGRLETDDVITLLSGAKLYVSPSLEEGFGLSLLEAMSVGIPCVISNIDAYRELAKDSAVYFDPLSSTSITERMLELLRSDPQKISDMTLKAQRIASEYTWEKSAQKLLAVFNQYKK